jgi:ankyrin repeat protein
MPLMAACRVHCCAAPVRLLLAHGADSALQTSTGTAALHSAASTGRADACKLLLEAGGCDPDVLTCDDISPLVLGVQQGHLQVVELLHGQWGADLSITRRSNGDTLLHLAAASGETPMLEYSLHKCLDVNAASLRGVLPVQSAAQAGNTAAVHILLEHGASITAVDDRGEIALMIAVREGHTGVVKLLLSSDGSSQPAVDVNAVDAVGDTALHMAARRDRTDAAALLLQYGAAVSVPDAVGSTPLMVAAVHSGAELVQLLLDAGADHPANACVLHAAAANIKHLEVLQLLLEQSNAGAMVDNLAIVCRCCGLRTAIMRCEQPEHLKLLLAAGADVRKATDRGNTALHVAAVHKFAAPVICLLIKAGVDLHAVNNDGKTAAKIAADSGNTLAAALLTRAARDT